MLTFTEAQLLGWVDAHLWAFLRVLALLGTLPVIGQRTVPMRLRVALAFPIALCAQATLPASRPSCSTRPSRCWWCCSRSSSAPRSASRCASSLAAVEFAGELVGLADGPELRRLLPTPPPAADPPR